MTAWVMTLKVHVYGAEAKWPFFTISDKFTHGVKALLGSPLVTKKLDPKKRDETKVTIWTQQTEFFHNMLRGLLCAGL